jgi:hypothetical protein
MGLGELAAHHRPAVRAVRDGQLGQRDGHPAAGLEVDLGAGLGGQNRSVGSPETASAVVTADGPGSAVTRRPASAAAATSR